MYHVLAFLKFMKHQYSKKKKKKAQTDLFKLVQKQIHGGNEVLLVIWATWL